MPMERTRVDLRFLRNCVGLILAPLMLAFGLTYWAAPSAAEIARMVPAPLVDEALNAITQYRYGFMRTTIAWQRPTVWWRQEH